MAWNIGIVAVLMLGSLTTIKTTTVEPGCSFYGNQCVYSIKLGHQNQCDSVSPSVSSTTGTDCCGDLTSKYTTLKDEMDKLKVQMDAIKSGLGAGASPTDIQNSLQKALADRDDILAVLNRKETELNDTKKELAKVMAKAAVEIEQLRNNLTIAQKSISSCQTALGKGSSSGSKPTTSPSNMAYHLTYYNFNKDAGDFTLSKYMDLLSSSSYGGPKTEHSWGIKQGHYLGINSGQIAENSYSSSHKSTLSTAESGTFQPADAYCIMFWYFMEGADVKTLTANLKINGGNGYPVFTTTGPRSTHKWELATIDLDSEYTSHQFQINITMKSSAYYQYSGSRKYYYNFHGDIAVDDLYVYNTSCNNVRHHPLGAFSYTQGNTTSYYTFHTTAMTWTEAYDVCRREGPWSALVSIDTDREQQFLVNVIQEDVGLNAVGQNGFYTSGTDADSEHNFIWTDKGVGRSITESSWHAGQPNNVAGDQDCLLMEYSGSQYEWGDVDCDTKHPFICEVQESK